MKDKKIEILDDIRTPEMDLAFPLREYKNRLNKIRNAMAEQNVDLLYLTMPESMCYVSGYNNTWYKPDSSKEWRDQQCTGIAIHVDHDNFILFETGDEEQLFLSNSVATDYVSFYDGHVDLFGKDYLKAVDGFSIPKLIVSELKARGWAKGRVAMELGTYRPSFLVSEKLQSEFRAVGCEVVDGTDICHSVRKLKSPMELQYIEIASNIADVGHKAIADHLKPGVTELDICGEYTRAMYKAGGENMGIVNMVRSGPERIRCFHAPATRRKVMPGEPLGVDLCGVYNRYHSNQCRYYSLGQPTQEFVEEYAMNRLVMEKVADIIKPNMYVREFNEEIEKFCKKVGIWGQGYWLGGYELGISFPPDWVGYYCYDPGEPLENQEERFEPGLVVNFETGFGIIDTLMFTGTEAKVLGKSTWDLVVVD